jgi:hypothetical protein
VTLERLSSEDREVIRRCLATLIDGNDLEGEFHTRLGVTESEVAELLMRWPSIDDRRKNSLASIAINNAMNEMLNGLGLSDTELERRVGTTRDRLARVYHEWASLRGDPSTGLR